MIKIKDHFTDRMMKEDESRSFDKLETDQDDIAFEFDRMEL